MRDYATISKRLRRYSENCVAYKLDADFANAVTDAADAIEELLDFAKWIAKEAIEMPDDEDGISAEIVCRKLHKIGIIQTNGDKWVYKQEDE